MDAFSKIEEANRRYNHSEKGKATQTRYRLSDKGKASQRRYINSEKGKAAQLRYQNSEKGIAQREKKKELNRLFTIMSNNHGVVISSQPKI